MKNYFLKIFSFTREKNRDDDSETLFQKHYFVSIDASLYASVLYRRLYVLIFRILEGIDLSRAVCALSTLCERWDLFRSRGEACFGRAARGCCTACERNCGACKFINLAPRHIQPHCIIAP